MVELLLDEEFIPFNGKQIEYMVQKVTKFVHICSTGDMLITLLVPMKLKSDDQLILDG